jgi:hypothetical protein
MTRIGTKWKTLSPAPPIAKEWVEVIACSSKRAGREPEPHEEILDDADGLDWRTLCKCDLKQRKGRVSQARQAQIVKTLLAAHDWSAVLRAFII